MSITSAAEAAIRCPHRPPCPGCPRFGMTGVDPSALAALAELARENGIAAPEATSGPLFGWRLRARLAVRGRARSPEVGLFQTGSHRIVDIPSCPIHHPLVNRAAAALRRAIRETGARPYADGPHSGLVRYLQVVVERPAAEGEGVERIAAEREGSLPAAPRAQLVVVANDDTPEACRPLFEVLQSELGDALHSLFWNGNPERVNTILGRHWHHVSGPESVCERIAGAEVFFPPGAFGQANLDLAGAMVERIAEALPAGGLVADLYAGCGAIGLPMLARGARVHFAERSAASLAGLRRSLEARPAVERERARVHTGPVAEAGELLCLLEHCDAVIADPPRKGLDAGLLAALAARPPARLVYVGCGLPALLLQARELIRGGRLRLTRLEAWTLIPNTAHVEVLAFFDRI